MPVLNQSTYVAFRWLRHGHLQTLYPVLFRCGPRVHYVRQRIDTPDGDFLDLDWSCVGSRDVGLIVHGLESSAQEACVRAMAVAPQPAGLGWCGVKPARLQWPANRLAHSYHAGAADDVSAAIEAVLDHGRYDELALIGLSLGGNLVLNYLGQRANTVPAALGRAAAVSVPCDLVSSAHRIMQRANRLYMAHMLRALKKKVRRGAPTQSVLPDVRQLRRIQNTG